MIAILALIGVFCLGLGLYASTSLMSRIIVTQSEVSSRSWASYVTRKLSNPEATFRFGKLTEDDYRLMDMVSSAAGVFRYKLFNKDGLIVLATRSRDIGKTETKPYFKEKVMQGLTYTSFSRGERSEELGNDPEKGRLVTETYVPVMRNGKFAGAIEVYIDGTEQMKLLSRIFGRGQVLLVILFVVVSAIVASVIRFNIDDRNSELQAVSDEPGMASPARQQLEALNEKLEQRAGGRADRSGAANVQSPGGIRNQSGSAKRRPGAV